MANVTGAMVLAKSFSVPVTTAATPTNPGLTVLELAIPFQALSDAAPLSAACPVPWLESTRQAGFERCSYVELIEVLDGVIRCARGGGAWEPPTVEISDTCPSIQDFIGVLTQLYGEGGEADNFLECDLGDQPNHVVAKVRADDDGNVVICTLVTHETPTAEQVDGSMSPNTGETDAGGTNRVASMVPTLPDELELAIQVLLHPFSIADEEKSMTTLKLQFSTSDDRVRVFRWAMQASETLALHVSERKDLEPKGGMEGLGVQLDKCLTICSCVRVHLQQLVQNFEKETINAALERVERRYTAGQLRQKEFRDNLNQTNVLRSLRERRRRRVSLEADMARLDEVIDWSSAWMPAQHKADSTGTSVPPDTVKPTADSLLVEHSEPQQKQMLGERLFPVVQKSHPKLAPKITGMLLEMDDSELLRLLEENSEALALKVEEAVKALEDHATDAILACARKTSEECDRKLRAWTLKREQVGGAFFKTFQPVDGTGRSVVAAAARQVLAREMEAIRSADELASCKRADTARKRADAAMQALVEEETQSIVQEKSQNRKAPRTAREEAIGRHAAAADARRPPLAGRPEVPPKARSQDHRDAPRDGQLGAAPPAGGGQRGSRPQGRGGGQGARRTRHRREPALRGRSQAAATFHA